MSELLRKYGFQVETGVGGIETSVKAVYDSGKPGLNVGFVGEFDAFPGMGHACGHNLMCAIACGAGIGLKSVIDTLGGKITVLGTPAAVSYTHLDVYKRQDRYLQESARCGSTGCEG